MTSESSDAAAEARRVLSVPSTETLGAAVGAVDGAPVFDTVPLAGYPELGSDWRALEELAQPEFFLSWHWISVWIEVYQPDALVLRARSGGRIVGLAILGRGTFRRRWALLRSRKLLLNQTGDRYKDQVWIEYNGILADPRHKSEVYGAAMQYLLSNEDHWEEVTLAGVDAAGAEQLVQQIRQRVWLHKEWHVPCFGVELRNLRESGRPYLETLSRNTRHQIRRSHKMYLNQGEVTVATPATTEEALVWLERVAKLHLARWGAGLDHSGFANPEFVAFHRALIQKLWSTGTVELLEVRVADRVIAAFLNFIYRNRAYFYLSGIVEEQDNKLKPGLLGHALCIQRYLDQGIDFYDLMGGDEHYKSRLAVRHNELVKIVMQKKKLKFGLEHLGRRAKKLIKQKG